MKQILKLYILLVTCVGYIYADEDVCKHSLKCSMVHIHEETAPEVQSITNMFTQGIFYGRLRSHTFGYKWQNEIDYVRKDHAITAIGGSVEYKSAYYHGIAIGAGLYTTQAKGSLGRDESYLYKSGKDTFSRYDATRDGKRGITTLAQAYLEYKFQDISLKVGRQIFESFLTKSNDTKMIPNTFEGVTVTKKSLFGTSLNLAYFTRQKLRDHADFHHVLTFGDGSASINGTYANNDDSAMHIGLTAAKLEAKEIEDRLIVLEATNKSIENLTFHANYTAAPQLITSAMVQVDYRVNAGDWYVIPAVRYMQQFDEGAGAIGGANLKTLTSGYTNKESLDTSLFAVRVDVVNDGIKLRFAYTDVADKGDILAPWRGFPTGGFTRTMGQYNWYANTKSYMVQLDYAFESIPDFKLISRFAVQDFDDNKIGVQADSNVFTLDLAKYFEEHKVYVKTRYAHVAGDANTIAANGLKKLNPSYDEIRFEINYLF